MKLIKPHIILIIFMVCLAALGINLLDTYLRYNINLKDYYKYSNISTKYIKNTLKDINITIGLNENPPYAFLNQGDDSNVGLMPDFTALMGLELGVPINTTTNNVESNLDKLENGDLSLVMVRESQVKDDNRFALSLPIYQSQYKILVLNNSDIKDSDNLKGEMLVIKQNTNTNMYAGHDLFDTAAVIKSDNIYQCFALLKKGVVKGFLCDDLEASYFARVTGNSNRYRFLNEVFYEDNICLALNKDNEALLNTVNKSILDMQSKGLIAQSQEKWIGSYNNNFLTINQLNWIHNTIIAVFSIMVIFSVWNYVITKQVNERTRELSESKEELNSIINTLQNGILVIQNNSKVIACNNWITNFTNISKEDIISKPLADISLLEPFLVKENMNKPFPVGNKYYYISSQSFTEDKKIIIIEDYTEKFLQERQARQEAKMIAVGQLSAGLAHEIRNPLGIIKSYGYILRKYCNDEISSNAVIAINDNVSRINSLVENLLHFSRLSGGEAKLVNISKLIDSTLQLEHKRLHQSNIKMTVNYKNLRFNSLKINDDVLKVVLLNLINNGIDALDNYEIPAKTISISISSDDNGLKISVKDNGPGIPKDKIEEIFNPFFSTKSQGTGLGLYILTTELNKINGSISVTSNINEGTEFKVFLPLGRD